MIENKVCEQPMLYSILFALTNYTLFGDHKQPLCYIHYDVNQPTARYFLPNNNLDLLRDIDYQAYRKEGCNVIAVKIRSIVVDHKKCPGEKYTVDDTKLPRPLLVCTCNGTKIDTITTKETKFCDEELRKNIGSKYDEIKDKLMPKCLVTKCPVKNFDENVSFNAVLENASIDMTTKSIFCYMELVKDSEITNENEIHNFSLSAGIASLENGYGEKCFNLYSETEGKGVSDEKPFCGSINDGKILCCIIGMGKEGNELPIQLLDEITEKVVEQRVIRNPALIKKLYQNQKSLKCRTSKITREFGYGNVCKYPHGCFWTDSSIGEVKTTVSF
uniref:Uncharacterized protein n=1 Tax=Panagrolaimus sp. ES5 TaxID=591445 RepID=A0AC34G844_9BILA